MAGLPPIPANVAPFIQSAAKATGLPESVVAAQNADESAYGTNLGPSSAGARGPWQFLPTTYTGLGFNVGTINQWGPSTQAYIKYMNQLLSQEHGNVRNALAAYNAGPANISAGLGYADKILAQASQSGNLQVGTATGTSSAGIGGVLGIPDQITGFFSDANSLVNKLMWLMKPSNWLRIGAFLAGVILLLFAIHAFIAGANGEPIIKAPNVVPIPV